MMVQESAKVLEEGLKVNSVSRGRKRKGEEPVAKAAKKTCSKDTENTGMAEGTSENIKEKDDGMAKTGEVKERAGRPTLSGRVPLMPTHLAEAGYQGEKKGIRGRKVQPTGKPKGYTAKPASKGAAKIAPKKKTK